MAQALTTIANLVGRTPDVLDWAVCGTSIPLFDGRARTLVNRRMSDQAILLLLRRPRRGRPWCRW